MPAPPVDTVLTRASLSGAALLTELILYINTLERPLYW